MPKSVRETFIDKFIKHSYAIDTKGYNVKPISDRELLEDFNELKKEIGVKANLFIWDNEIDKWATVNKNGSIGILTPLYFLNLLYILSARLSI